MEFTEFQMHNIRQADYEKVKGLDDMLTEEDKKEIQNRLKTMIEPVTLVYFTQQLIGPCRFCLETEQLLKELAPLSDKLSLEIKNFIGDREDVQKFGVDKIPAICLTGERDYGIRMYGIPTGYEFLTFLETILRISSKDSGLSQDSRNALKGLKKPVHIQIFVTPTCPYCPRAAMTGFQFAMESEMVRCDVVEITEFPHLTQKYGVMGVPKIVINEKGGFEGALPENQFLNQLLQAV